MSPTVGASDLLEDKYTKEFESLIGPFGILLDYQKDRAAIDKGLHLYTPDRDNGQAHPSQIKVWFQLKGKAKETISAERLKGMEYIPVAGLPVDTVQFWLASPECVYLVVYLEATDQFFAEDVCEIVRRQQPDAVSQPKLLSPGNETVTLNVSKSAILNESVIKSMLNHRTLRIDGPAWRGRPLGHNLDPLRSEISPVEPEAYRRLVGRILDAHDFEWRLPVDLSSVSSDYSNDFTMCIGTMKYTYEWTTPLFTEFGFGPGHDFRIESAPEHVQGMCAVLVDARINESPLDYAALNAVCGELSRRYVGVSRLLAFINRPHDDSEFGRIRNAAQPWNCLPQHLGSLTFNLLTATLIYLEFRESLTMKIVNFL
jgi:hypothetical protein